MRTYLWMDNIMKAREGDDQFMTFLGMPLIWDTGASRGLTPFRADFIDYQEVDVIVHDISKANRVIGIGTVMYKFVDTNGKEVYLPGVAYHMPNATIRLFSPQSYIQSYGGHATLEGSMVTHHLPPSCAQRAEGEVGSSIEFPINVLTANTPMVSGVACTDKERSLVGPHLMSAIPSQLLDFRTRTNLVIDDHEFEFLRPTATYMTRLNTFKDVVAPGNTNLTKSQQELLMWHWKFGISMGRVQSLMQPQKYKDANDVETTRKPVIEKKQSGSSSCPIPRDSTWEMARAKRRSPKVMKQIAIKEREGVITAKNYKVGEHVSVDQYVVKTPGRLFSGYGRESSDRRYHGGTIFNDAASGAIYAHNQVSLGACETVLAKQTFEEWLHELAFSEVKHYHGDNGIFTATEFREDCELNNQTQSFSGVGAKHQNARAERSIQTIMAMARTYMIHVGLRWTERGSDNLALWAFAVRHAVWTYNRLPNVITGLTPYELMTRHCADHQDLRRSHVWGCPVYVLDPKIQDGGKVPKWKRRARLGQFVGFSEEHSSLVALVRNLLTGKISPQYHVVFDDAFQTVFGVDSDPEVVTKIDEEIWENGHDYYAEAEYDESGDLVYSPPPLEECWLTEAEIEKAKVAAGEQKARAKRRRQERIAQIPGNTTSDWATQRDLDIVSDDDDSLSAGDSESEGDFNLDNDDEIMQTDGISNDSPTGPHLIEEDDPGEPEGAEDEDAWTRTGGRLRRRHVNFADVSTSEIADIPSRIRSRHVCSMSASMPPKASRQARDKTRSRRQAAVQRQTEGDRLLTAVEELDSPTPSISKIMSSPLAKFVSLAARDSGYDGSVEHLLLEYVHPLFLKAKAAASAADNPNWNQAMNSEFANDWWKAAVKEIQTLEEMDAWEVVDRPPDANIVGGTWAFKLKRYPDGQVKKFKARFCARGDQQKEGIDFFETYAPVVQWTTVRLMLILEVLLNLKSKQGDVTAAFLHASVEKDEKIYVHMPRGFSKPGKVLKLKKTLYGLRQSPRAFWKYMVQKMADVGMPQSDLDPCLFIGEKVICIVYVDDLLFWARDETDISEVALKLRDIGVDLEQEDDAAGFLGVDMVRDSTTGLIEMKQTGLIKRIIDALGLDDGNVARKLTPSSGEPLIRDETGDPFEGDFNYASVVGMLLYLSGHSRPDITYAVNCCARYMFNPRKRHEIAIKRIGRYLKGTANRGLIINPNKSSTRTN